MTREQEFDVGQLVQENRRLREAIEVLLEELEESGQTKGHGEKPESGPDTERVRSQLPDVARNAPGPPWEREGYESKQEWLDDR